MLSTINAFYFDHWQQQINSSNESYLIYTNYSHILKKDGLDEKFSAEYVIQRDELLTTFAKRKLM